MTKSIMHRLESERLTPGQRIVRCTCGWTTTAPRKNGAWMTLKKRLRVHAKAENAKALCQTCGKPASSFEPDPYQSELHDDHTPGWYCAECLKASALEI